MHSIFEVSREQLLQRIESLLTSSASVVDDIVRAMISLAKRSRPRAKIVYEYCGIRLVVHANSSLKRVCAYFERACHAKNIWPRLSAQA